MKDFTEQQLWLAPWYFFISATNGADERLRYHVDDNKVYVEGILKVATKVGHPPPSLTPTTSIIQFILPMVKPSKINHCSKIFSILPPTKVHLDLLDNLIVFCSKLSLVDLTSEEVLSTTTIPLAHISSISNANDGWTTPDACTARTTEKHPGVVLLMRLEMQYS